MTNWLRTFGETLLLIVANLALLPLLILDSLSGMDC